MIERIRGTAGTSLDPHSYLADFWPHFQQLSDAFVKFERFQTFREPEVPSWVAMTEGDWDRSVRLAQEMRGEIEAEISGVAAGGARMRRIRVIEPPISPYLQWESQVLRLRAEAGEDIRVVGPKDIAGWEAGGTLPELVVLDDRVLYEVCYDDTDALSGARRIDDPTVVKECRADLAHLFDHGEDFLAYFQREIAPLPPPTRR